MAVLLLRMSGPMQSWGLGSRFSERDTAREPTKSGVIGLLCAALGKPREESPGDGFPTLAELSALRFAVRADREGVLRRDFQTAGGGPWPERKKYGVAKASGAKGETVISNRYYLADAVFLVGLEGEPALLRRLGDAVRQPVWPFFLGRKGYVPDAPVFFVLREDGSLCDLLMQEPPLAHDLFTRPGKTIAARPPAAMRVVRDCIADEEGELRQDVPVSFARDGRAFGLRRVREYSVTPQPAKEGKACI